MALVRLLLSAGAAANHAYYDGATPLLKAAECGQVEIASLLLDAGAGVDVASNDGVTPLYVACAKGHAELARRPADPQQPAGKPAALALASPAEQSRPPRASPAPPPTPPPCAALNPEP